MVLPVMACSFETQKDSVRDLGIDKSAADYYFLSPVPDSCQFVYFFKGT